MTGSRSGRRSPRRPPAHSPAPALWHPGPPPVAHAAAGPSAPTSGSRSGRSCARPAGGERPAGSSDHLGTAGQLLSSCVKCMVGQAMSEVDVGTATATDSPSLPFPSHSPSLPTPSPPLPQQVWQVLRQRPLPLLACRAASGACALHPARRLWPAASAAAALDDAPAAPTAQGRGRCRARLQPPACRAARRAVQCGEAAVAAPMRTGLQWRLVPGSTHLQYLRAAPWHACCLCTALDMNATTSKHP